MSDLGGALLLSSQLEAYRWEDQFNRNRREDLIGHNSALRQQNADLVNRYNALLADANRLCKSHDAQIEAMDGTIDALRGTITEIKTREARLTEERDRAQLRYETLLSLHKERDPNFKFYEE